MTNDERRPISFTCSICGRTFLSSRKLICHGYSHNPQVGGQSRSAINGTAEVKTLRPVGEDKYDLVKFLSSVRADTEKYLLAKVHHRAIKWYIVAQVELTREDREGEIRTVQPFFRSTTYSLLTADTFEIHDLNEALQKLVIGIEKYIHESSGWILRTVIKLDRHTVLYKPLGGSSYMQLPATLENSHSVLNIKK